MFILKKSNRILTRVIVLFLIITLLIPGITPAFATNSLWNKTFPQKIQWETMTYLGVILAGTDDYLIAIDGKTGEVLWTKSVDNVEIKREQVWPVDGTDIVIISDKEKKLGGIISNASLYALEVMTGDVIWYASHITGRGLDVIPMLDKNLLLYITDQVNMEAETLSEEPIMPYIYAVNIHTGKVEWEREYEKAVEGVKLKDDWLGYKKFDLSGYYPPLNLGEELYFFYSGITKWDLKTGETLWQTTYPTGDQKLLKTDADPVFTEEVIYSSGRGQIKAINRETGELIWDSGTLGIVPLILREDNIIWVQKGGFFYNTLSEDWISQGPFGVSAIDAKTGEVLWNYNKTEGSIANILLLEDKVIIGDRKHITALDKYTGEKIYINDLSAESPVYSFVNFEKNIIFKYPQEVEARNSDTGAQIWKTEVEIPKSALSAAPFRFTAGLFLSIMTGGAAAMAFFSFLIVIDYAIPQGGATIARLKAKYAAEQAYWATVNEYRNTPGLQIAKEVRDYRLEVLEGRKYKDPHLYLEGQLLKDRRDFIGVVGINTRNGNVDQGVYLGEIGELYLIDYVEELFFHFDGEEINGYSLKPE